MKTVGSFFVAALLGLSHSVHAQFDPTKVVIEPLVISQHFNAPTTRFSTPAFAAGRENFTSFAEAVGFLNNIAQRHNNVRIEKVGAYQVDQSTGNAYYAGDGIPVQPIEIKSVTVR